MADGLLDWIKTPEGQGLLSAAFGGLAGARRGQPFNSVGRAGLAGLSGYANAQDQQAQMAQADQMKQLREMQIAEMKAKMDDQALDRKTAAGFFTPAIPASGMLDSSLPAAFQTGATPMAAQPAKFDMEGYAQARMGQNPTAGVALMQALQKESPFNKVDAEKFTPESIAKFAKTKNYGDLQPVRKLEANEGVVWNPYDPKMAGRTLPNPNKPFQLGPQGEILPNTAFQNYELSKAKAGASSNIINAFEPFGNKLQGEMANQLVKRYDALQSAPQTIQALDKAKTLVGTSVPFVGSGADTKLALVKFMNNNLGTSISQDAVKDAETLRSTLFASVMENLKKMDASPSQQQQQVLQDAFGRLNTDPKALPQIIDFWRNQVQTSVREHNKRVKQASEGPAKVTFPYNITVDLPESSTARSVVRTGRMGGRVVNQYSDGSIDYAD